MPYDIPDIPEEDWKQLTTLEQERLTNGCCLRCGKKISGQEYYGSLCKEHSEEYMGIADQDKGESDDSTFFLAFIRDRKEKVCFT